MITDAILGLIYYAVDFLIGQFPNADVQNANSIYEYISGLKLIAQQLNFIFPIGTFVAILTLYFAITHSRFTMWLINWVFNKVRGSG